MAKLKKGDKVLVITGRDRNKTGVIERVFAKDGKVIVSGLNMVKKHLKRSQQNPQGGIIDKSLPLQISNVMLLDPASNKPTRVGFRVNGQEKVRISKVSKEPIITKEGK
ncbi:MAG TPA: 50S ribosomal protein L24 [Candidatus Saccharimonadales bacterium]|nr:50S ribosomal protein L24 [Candidatus Saccharimonadales bacterium]